MAELNYDILRANIQALLDKHDMGQEDLAEIAGMSQPNVSKALSDTNKKQFNLDQLFRIAQHFGISIDELVGNTAANVASTSQRAILTMFTQLLSSARMKETKISVTEEVYTPFRQDGYWDCEIVKQKHEYKAFYFPNFHEVGATSCDETEIEDEHETFLQAGNESANIKLNAVFNDFLPLIEMYRKGKLPEEPFKMVLNGYLEQLSDK